MEGKRAYGKGQKVLDLGGATAGKGQGQKSLVGGRPKSESLDVEVEEVIYESEDRSFAVVRISPLEGEGTGSVRAAGQVAGVIAGESARLRGRHVNHPRHGPQFEVESWEPIEPRTTAGIERYLGSGLIPGVGKRVASSIIARHGAESLTIICEKPHMLRQIRGIGKKLANRIHKAVSGHRAEAEALAFLRSYGMGMALARRVLELYGEDARTLISEDPYRMAEEIKGVGFQTADRIARELGVELDAPARAEAAILHLLSLAKDKGHVAFPTGELVEQAERLEVSAAAAKVALERLVERLAVVNDAGLTYQPGLHGCEAVLASDLRALASGGGSIAGAARHLGEACLALGEKQVHAVKVTLEQTLVVITGGPGTGKTTTLRAVVDLHGRLGRDVALAAPTGRAARRLSEVTEHQAQTVHRLLEFSPTQGFIRRRDNPIDADLVVVDEASMLDVPLAYRLTSAVRSGAGLVLVGDVDQLPSVGVGNVLRDLIDSGVAEVVRLTHVFRQAAQSGIVTNAHRVNLGRPPMSIRRDDGETSDFHVVRAEDPERGLDLITQLVCDRIPSAFGLDPIRDIQVLAPMYRGRLGCDAINKRLRERLGDPTERSGLRGWRHGDKVMQIRNDYEKEVFNGDMGRVLSVTAEELVVKIDGRAVEYDAKSADDLRLAYCVTVHKSQGSEYPAVVVVVHKQHYIMLARNLLYTAITRGKQLVVLVGSPKAMARAAATDRLAIRHGRLRERLIEGVCSGSEAPG